MQKVKSLQGKWRNVVFFFITALLLVAADQFSKLWIRSNLAVGESLFEVGFFRLTRVHNSGAAFGLFQGQSFLLTIIALVGVAALLLYVFFFHHKFPFLDNRLGKLALGLVFGGTVGNLIDRLHLGYITDFINFNLWPAFNIADSAIVVGTIILAYSLLCVARARKH
ncbi:Lipoprotein signal peptidase [subsurface metagenome]